MARFILDVANLKEEQIKEIQQKVADAIVPTAGVITITCIDTTNDSQFNENEEDDVLTKRQIEKYHRIKTGYNLIFDTFKYGIVKVRPAMINFENMLEEGVSIYVEDTDELHEFITEDYDLLREMSNNEFEAWFELNKKF